jgi:hypothetical protein
LPLHMLLFPFVWNTVPLLLGIAPSCPSLRLYSDSTCLRYLSRLLPTTLSIPHYCPQILWLFTTSIFMYMSLSNRLWTLWSPKLSDSFLYPLWQAHDRYLVSLLNFQWLKQLVYLGCYCTYRSPGCLVKSSDSDLISLRWVWEPAF